MAINPNIALGIQPIQQPNMLGMATQAMALKAAQQDIQGNEELRAAYAQGGDLNDPEFRRRVMAANPKLGSELIKRNAETGKLQNEAIANRIKLSREMLTNVNTPEDYIAWHESNHKDPVLNAFFSSRGITAEQSRAKIVAELSKPGGLERLKKESALGAEKLITEQLQTDRTFGAARISAAPGHRQASVAEQRLGMEQDQLKAIQNILGGGVSTTAPVVTGGGGGGPAVVPPAAGGPVVAPPAAGGTAVVPPVAGGPAVAPPAAGGSVNALAPTTPPPVNALVNPPADRTEQIKLQITQLAKLGNAKAQQAIEGLVKEYNILNPTKKIQQDASGALITIDERTNRSTPVLGPDSKPVMGKLPYESAFGAEVGKAQAGRNEKVVTQAQAAPDSIRKIDETIAILRQGDATTGLGAELRTNIDRARALLTKDIQAGKRVSDTQILDALLGSDVFPMIQSLGIGARGLDTPAERDYLRQVMTGTIQMDRDALIRLSEIRRNMEVRAIEKYNRQLEKGELNKYFETQGLKPEKIEVPTVAGGAGSNTVSVGGVTYTFPDAAAAAKFKKEAGIK